ncbi:outer membrane protein assembly factor BamB [uncultured Paraglaciecola sp.]|uniref:outer membrane protein assembly factor BamB n=1 Tax=uncultured Paraglaciecola sp. TaxID=1765024 RepID=UPI002600A1EF|nr:outer membrane protein assembly factor BamB [uncultured Paraglaciecola sp.]
MKQSFLFLLLTCSVLLSSCTTISNWFYDEEELEIRRLKPIDAQFTPTESWSVDLGQGIGKFYSKLKPAVAYDKVFAANRQGAVSAFDQATGKKVWSKNFATFDDKGLTSGISNLWSNGLSAKIAGGLSVAYETVFFGTENGEVVALDTNTGEQKWITTVKGEVLAAPAIEAGIVLINTGSGFIFALNADDGEEVWSSESDVPPLSLRGVSSPAAVNGGAIIGTATGKLVVNILETGQTAWEQVISAATGVTELERIVDIDSEPLVAGGNVYAISYDGTLAAVELRTGRVIWKREYKSYRHMSISGSTLFVVDINSNVFALDSRNGVELWSQGALKQRLLTGVTPVGNYLVGGDKYGYLHWFDQADGKIVARLKVGDDDEDEGIYHSPVVDGDVLYTQTRDGKLVAIKTL